MAKRPPLNDTSFLGHLFSPKKNPLPAGLRKTHLSGLKGGRVKGRLAAYNRMSPTSQEVLKRSGQRESYLKGETTLGAAKASLRKQAVFLGLAKPAKGQAGKTPGGYTRSQLDDRVAKYITDKIRDTGRLVSQQRIREKVPFIPDDVIGQVEKWDFAQIRYAARNGSEYETYVDGQKANGFWYH